MEEKKNIYQKLFEVKKAGIKLQRDVKAYNYKYADLSQIQEKLNVELQKQNLLVSHKVHKGSVYTEIIDIDSPENIVSSEIELTPNLQAQDKGSEITYYRRYNLLSLLDLEVEDDDGKKASQKKKTEILWLNFKNFEALIEAGNTTEEQLRSIIKEDGYTLSTKAKECVRHYVETGEINNY